MADRRLGILLGRDTAEAAFLATRRRGRYRMLARAVAEAREPLWEGDRPGLAPLFRALARSLPSEARRADVRQAIAIPDPLVTEDRLGFRDLPEDPDEARALILWRVARDHRKSPESLACAWQSEKVEGDETRVLVRILDRALVDAITDAAGAAGFFPTRIDGWSGYVLNRPGVAETPSGARLWANADWWSLMCWARAEGAETETLVHAEWRDPETPVPAIAEKARRLAKSFALSRGAGPLEIALEAPEPLASDLSGPLGATPVAPPAEAGSLGAAEGADCVALDPA